MSKITLEASGFIVELKEFVDRKTAKAYNSRLFAGITASPDTTPKVPLENIEPANEELVKSMIASVETIDPDHAAVGWLPRSDEDKQHWIDNLHAADFTTLATACQAMVNGNAAEKKS